MCFLFFSLSSIRQSAENFYLITVVASVHLQISLCLFIIVYLSFLLFRQTQLYKIQTDPKTYCHEPEGPPELYENWLESFDINEFQEEMTKIMMTCSEVQNLYDKFVSMINNINHFIYFV